MLLIKHFNYAASALDGLFVLTAEPNPYTTVVGHFLNVYAVDDAFLLADLQNLVLDVREEVEITFVYAVVEHVREEHAGRRLTKLLDRELLLIKSSRAGSKLIGIVLSANSLTIIIVHWLKARYVASLQTHLACVHLSALHKLLHEHGSCLCRVNVRSARVLVNGLCRITTFPGIQLFL